jgi:phosphotransferase system HPr (HPr) family protein
MFEVIAYVKSKYGIHARPSAAICSEAKKFNDTKIVLLNPDNKKQEIDAKELLSVLGINRKCGDPIIIRAHGKNEQVAAEAIAQVVHEYEIIE